MPTKTTKSVLSLESINSNVIEAEYAVRGEIVQIAQKLAKELEKGATLPFQKLVWCNIGNPQILGQKPITYFRQVLSLCEYPELLSVPEVEKLFPTDVLSRARQLLEQIPGGVGAYSESAGAFVVRKLVAEAIARRDRHPCNPEEIYMTDGASPAVHYMMDLLIRDGRNDAVMVPIPQYPLYSATLTLYGGKLVPYMLNESCGWSLDVQHLRQQLHTAREQGLCVRGMVVINPGNPTGQCLSLQNQEDILMFCKEESLVLIADEVYQANIYDEKKEFFSFKKVVCDMGILNEVPLVSLHSISKGFVGECGRRGGYMAVTGFPESVTEQILKLASINLCPNISGQICCALMMNPPQEGEPSFELYEKEKNAILGSLKRRAELLVSALNKLEGVSCNAAEGALYAFPRITLPQKAIDVAKSLGKSPDWLYCRDLLQQYGIVVVPGSGFGQADGTFHFRTTFLPSETDIGLVVDNLTSFHTKFMVQYGGIRNTNGTHHLNGCSDS
ncbi:hypothetical protein CEUSTIGMA_g13909.t1 [Chlamydomonas eustigma]|uniref:alanine transaminase n=1 Tax=Chlamydomonas eustigma TaxID=1157962 RepID=A0A250XTU2_9CHLO|nr:hypothetical protein CEUSTIGMA_g13909.t1 [Chlamydomonas eustigma]|eukprot:GAX86501.1 hypothetical protein CEUSTIGMA_g13909.t1 [Chlamydomonas eustigma]